MLFAFIQVCNFGHLNGGMNLTEYQASMSIWSVLSVFQLLLKSDDFIHASIDQFVSLHTYLYMLPLTPFSLGRSIFGSPLIISANLPTVPSDCLALLNNTEVIAIDQDPLGSAGDVISINHQFLRADIKRFISCNSTNIIYNSLERQAILCAPLAAPQHRPSHSKSLCAR